MIKLRGERKQDARLDGGFRHCGVAAAVIGSAVVGAAVSSNSASKAAKAQTNAAQQASDTQMQMYNQTRADQAPYRQAGATALGQLTDGFAPGGQFTHQFGANDLKTNLAPNYDFMLNQGLGALNNQSSVTGGLVGGNALKGINDYAQNYASNGYQQAFDNYNTNQTNIFNRLSNIAGLGQTSNGQTNQAGMNTASNVGSAQLAGGAARASGYIGQGNAISGLGNSIASMYGSGAFGNSGAAAQNIGSSGSYANNDFLGE